MAGLTPSPKQQIFGSDGLPLVGGKIYTYAGGTSTPIATYTDFGADTVIAPLVSPEITTDDIYFLYRTTQRAPLGMVTVMPLLTVIGPVDIALKPVLRV